MRASSALAVALGTAWTFSTGAAVTALATQPFTVRDSIEMTKLVDPDAAMAAFQAPAFKVSPDEQQVAIVLQRGDLGSGLATFWIAALNAQSVTRYVNGQSKVMPRLEPLASFSTSANAPAIDQLQWLPDSRRLVFIGQSEGEPAQLHVLDTTSRTRQQLTHHASDVTRFGMSPDGRTLVYAARNYPDWSRRNVHGYALQSQYVGSLTWSDPRDYPADVRYFITDLSSGKTTPIDAPPSRYSPGIDISPSGRYAVFVAFDVDGIPVEWSRYELIRQRARLDTLGVAADGSAALQNEALGGRSNWFGRLLLVDIAAASAMPIIDSPAMPDQGLRVLWSADDASLLLINVLMPLSAQLDSAESQRRATVPAVAVLDVQTGVLSKLTDVAQGVSASGEWRTPNKLRVTLVSTAKKVPEHRGYVKVDGTWQSEILTERRANERSTRLRYSVEQGMNAPIEVAATDLKTGRKAVLTHLNPQLQKFDLGTVTRFDWTDQAGRTYKGGLVLPPSYDAARRYPVVIQTYGFDPNTFVVDGPFGITSAYAARPLANADMLVMQLPLRAEGGAPIAKCEEWSQCGENPQFLQKFDSAVDALKARNLILHDRVGLLGFSREGMHAFYAATFSEHALAAVTVADSIGSSPFAYTLFYGVAYPGMLEFEDSKVMGAPFWQGGIKNWLERSPLFHLERIRSPVRFETYGKGIPGYIDAFALLRRQERPAELIHIPFGTHLLQSPFARYTSQQGNVDWFRFWLKDEEDADPAKAEQYARWRKLKEQRLPEVPITSQ